MKTFKNFFRLFTAAFLLVFFAFSSMSFQIFSGETTAVDTPDTCPTASFSIANNGVDAGMPVGFVNQSSGASSYHWDFGDGGFSCEANPSYAYTSPGTYTVKLKAVGEGCIVEFIGTVDAIIN